MIVVVITNGRAKFVLGLHLWNPPDSVKSPNKIHVGEFTARITSSHSTHSTDSASQVHVP